MRGLIKFYEGGEVVGETENLITNAGKNVILRYLAKMTNDYAGSMAIGLDGTAAAAADIRLGIQTAKMPVIMRSVDYTNQTIIFKSTIDPAFIGKVYEVGLLSSYEDAVTGSYSSKILTAFEGYETWAVTSSGTLVQTDPYAYAQSRVGSGYKWASLQTNSGWVQYDNFKKIDLSGYSDTDQVSFGHISYSNRLTSLVTTFTDFAGNTATYTQAVTTHTAGDSTPQYNIYRVNKSAYTLSSTSFDWSGIIKLTARTNASGTAGTSPYGLGAWDFIGMIDTDTLNPDYALVTRSATGSVLATKTGGKAMDIEYKLVFNL